MFMLPNNNFARASRYFVHFFAVVARLRYETFYFEEPSLRSRWTHTKIVAFFFFNLDNDRYGRKKNLAGFEKLNEIE